jgi:3-oxoisoapionate decarboxylase
MRLGISSYTYGWAVGVDGDRPEGALTALDLVDRAAELGVGVLQICDNLPAATFEPAGVELIAARAAEKGVSIELGTRGISAPHLQRFALIASRLRSPILRVVIDTADDHPDEAQVIQRLRPVMPAFADAGVMLAIENHDRFPAASLLRIIEAIDSPNLGICLDTVNSFGALEGPGVVVETLGPWVANLHLKDFAIQRLPHLQGFVVEGRPLGQGMLDIPWLLERLRHLGRNPSAIIELWTPPESDRAATIDKEAAWARQSVRAARRWIG